MPIMTGDHFPLFNARTSHADFAFSAVLPLFRISNARPHILSTVDSCFRCGTLLFFATIHLQATLHIILIALRLKATLNSVY